MAPTGVEEPPDELLLAIEADELAVLDADPETVVNCVMVDLDVALEVAEVEGGGVCMLLVRPARNEIAMDLTYCSGCGR
jgi:hypothetical protein